MLLYANAYREEQMFMPLLQVRNFPEDMYQELKKRAEAEHRTIAQQAVVFLKMSLNVEAAAAQNQINANIARRRKLLKEIRSSKVPKAAREVDDVKWIREDRNR
ncbi:MAG: hypothetical protein LBQ83_00320 [Candidatus Margulisbacteria bacterium]|jgi:plasmid stability protein|nr:hypothetical protein [Candidatus Margulisiibacteriota bacterium]